MSGRARHLAGIGHVMREARQWMNPMPEMPETRSHDTVNRMPTPLTAAILSDALADLTARDPRLAHIVAGSAAGV